MKDATNEKTTELRTSESKIFPNDLLTIVVNTNTPEASFAFNLPLTPNQVIGNSTLNTAISLQSYLVSNEGTIDFPVIGKIFVAGKTKTEVEELIKNKIYPQYITEVPIINIRFVNFSISVLGEVSRPGSFPIPNEKVNIFEALAMAGDMTIYGKRDNVLLLRENNGVKETVRLNIQDKNITSSPYYYLQQNDILYIEPNKPKANSAAISSGETLSISITSTLISLTSLLVTVLHNK